MSMFRSTVILLGLAAAGCVSTDRERVLDYADIAQREGMLYRTAHSDYPDTVQELGRIIETGGIFAVRDYLLYLGKRRPDAKEYYWRLPLTLGKQPVIRMHDRKGRAEDQVWVRPNFANIVDARPMKEHGVLSSERKYTYNDLAQIVERTFQSWRMLGSDAAYGIYATLEAGGVVFGYVPCAGAVVPARPSTPVAAPGTVTSPEAEKRAKDDAADGGKRGE
jgi:hypothetical protein